MLHFMRVSAFAGGDSMKKLAIAATTLGVIATGAHAGSIQRDSDRSQVLFEEGKNYLQFSATAVAANIEGTDTGGSPAGALTLGRTSGNISDVFVTYSLAYKREINDKLAFALIANEPVGADVSYANDPDFLNSAYFFAGSEAEVDSLAITALLKYQVTDRISVYGGPRVQRLDGNVSLGTPFPLPGPVGPIPAPIPGINPYSLTVSPDIAWGYVLGAAFEIPDIALRVALTYDSKIEHDFVDNNNVPFDVEIPQALTLHFRSGVAANTLVFGSIRWQEWTEFEVAPADFLANPLNTSGIPIAFGTEDYITYELGVGRRFNENWSGALTVGFEDGGSDPVGNLEGRDGFTSVGASVRYSTESYDLTFGVKYFDFGSTNTTTINANFSGNDAFAFGTQLAYRF